MHIREETSAAAHIPMLMSGIACKNGLQNLLAEGLIASFALQASAQILDTILNDATQRSKMVSMSSISMNVSGCSFHVRSNAAASFS